MLKEALLLGLIIGFIGFVWTEFPFIRRIVSFAIVYFVFLFLILHYNVMDFNTPIHENKIVHPAAICTVGCIWGLIHNREHLPLSSPTVMGAIYGFIGAVVSGIVYYYSIA